MGKYKEKILDRSIWLSATPPLPARSLPFYIMEAGHFIATNGYTVKRDSHDSFLLLYTIAGFGTINTENCAFSLPPGNCIIIDCHSAHEYFCVENSWEFLWIHFNGCNMKEMHDILYNSDIRATQIDDNNSFQRQIFSLLKLIEENNIENCIEVSAKFHYIFNDIYRSVVSSDTSASVSAHSQEVDKVIEYIKNNYSSPITVDDMVSQIHLSKYYFIRIFKRIIGITPYGYLTNHRINVSKQLLRSSKMSISEIAEQCGFLDDSNFIYQFKKHTGQTPLHYRRDFSV